MASGLTANRISSTFDGFYKEDGATVTSASNVTTIDCSLGNNFKTTLTENTTFSFINVPTGNYALTLKVTQDAGASGFTIAFPSGGSWIDGVIPDQTATSSARDVYIFDTDDQFSTYDAFQQPNMVAV